MEEFWLPIKGYENIYEISSLARVKSLGRYVVRNGVNSFLKEKLLNQGLSTQGYYVVVLSKNGVPKTLRISILVAKHFIPNPQNHPFVRHLNDIKTDNRLENLAWGTRKDNAQDSIRNGTFHSPPKGKKHHWYQRKGKIKPILLKNIITGDILNISQAAKVSNISPSTMNRKVHGVLRNNTPFIKI